MAFKNANNGVVALKSQNTRRVVGKLPIPTFIPTSAQEFLDVTNESKPPKGLPERVVATQSTKPLELPGLSMGRATFDNEDYRKGNVMKVKK